MDKKFQVRFILRIIIIIIIAILLHLFNNTKQGSLPALVAALPHVPAVVLLLNQGASPNVLFPASLLGSDDATLQTSPLVWATRMGSIGLVKLLLEHGADPSMPEV